MTFETISVLNSSVDPEQDLSGGSTGVLEREEQRQATEPGDHERFKHFVPKDKLADAMINGTPVVALCGKVWVPSRDPERFPMCPSCLEIWEGMESGDAESGQGRGGRGFFGFGRGKK
ncbi:MULTISPECIES: DUF3039 domain-containing protein [Auritidibacter]|uniref:DUF3039 domain-containing protein n=1 Tax=Auritidibacter ignavus TaxID=678932 RepID=A0AAJ6APB6_9MICC|nr:MULTISPECIES: DUF3039 domain-containing protein [Auritidibacter]AXR73244.1 DUF3039 domain-containing protein [Auritidibacter sp. NML130574]NIH70995.1 hypothetical protein [Auritidibacter ignavus]PXA77523.1 DUF3039 domain-containing protein [Auritidibacter sp. NML100628]PXA81999.1 DUF3039 domain-containing protein [Auritidibacter sp. NML120636]RMX24155.1 DUF3039 domain-containing protein [Auritidibacter ignavus]